MTANACLDLNDSKDRNTVSRLMYIDYPPCLLNGRLKIIPLCPLLDVEWSKCRYLYAESDVQFQVEVSDYHEND